MCNYFKIHSLVSEKKSFKGSILFIRALQFKQFGRGSEGPPRTIPVKLFEISPVALQEISF